MTPPADHPEIGKIERLAAWHACCFPVLDHDEPTVFDDGQRGTA